MRHIVAGIMILFVVVGVLYPDTVTRTITTSSLSPVSKVTGVYEDSQVDKVYFTRQAGMSSLSFMIHCKDSASITDVILFRVFNNVDQSVQVGDTLVSSLTSTAAFSKIYAITLSPLAEQYYVQVTYAGSANGVTTPTVTYGLGAVYNK